MALLVALGLLASACVSTVDSDYPEGLGPGGQVAVAEDPGQEEAAPAQSESGDADSSDGDSSNGDASNGVAEPSDGTADGSDLPVGAVADPAAWASIEQSPCSFDELVPLPTAPTCYSISVPENWNDPDPADQVVLQAAVFEAEAPTEDALIYFDGGPGGHTLESLSFTYPNLVEPYLGERDYVFFDQRGLGESEPSLGCPELLEVALADIAGQLDGAASQAANLDAQDACRDRLVAAGIDLAAYNSVASANDIEAMRQLMGYSQFNVLGLSYGTRLAQSYMRMYPESSRTVVLDSVFPTGADLWSNFNRGAIRSFEELFAGCAASATCSAEFPDFRDRFFELLDQLDEQPAELEVQNLLTGETVPAVVDGNDLMSLVFSALYDQSQFAALPQMVEEGLAGNYDTITLFGSILVTNLPFVSYGMRLSVECNEEIPFESLEVLEADKPTEPPYDRLAGLENELTLFDLCERWPAGVAPEVESLPVVSEIPTLLLAGQYDPITPPAGADDVAVSLGNNYSFLLPHEGHGIMPTECGAELVNAFVADPATEPDSSCIALTEEPVWVPGTGGPIELIEFELEGLVAVAGLRPDGWDSAGNGAFVRQQTAVDPTALLIQPTNGLPGETLIALLGTQIEIDFDATESIEIDGVVWETYSSVEGSDQAARAAFKPGADGVFVLLLSSDAEIDGLYDEIFVSVAAAARPV